MENNKFGLNDEQQKAVLATDGPVLVIAGAGSGKTRVLTARVCHLIDIGVDPYNILAITFTNKAANEMKERIEKATSVGAQVWTSTFHSMCAKMLRFDIDRLGGYSSDFTIYTEQESERVVKRVIETVVGADPKNKSDYAWHISRAKTFALSPDEYYDESKRTWVQGDLNGYGYEVHCARMVRGVPCNTTQHYSTYLFTFKDIAAPSWLPEAVTLRFEDGPYYEFDWSSPMEMDECLVEDSTLLPFKDIMDIVGKRLPLLLDEYARKRDYCLHDSAFRSFLF